MTEKESLHTGSGCHTFGRIVGPEGKPDFLDIAIGRGGVLYTISVATPRYISRIEAENTSITDPDQKHNTNIFSLNDLSDPERVCQLLTSEPIEKLRPFLRPQNPQTEDNNQ